MQPVSGIARPLDFSYPTNRAIVIFSLAVFVTRTAATALTGIGIVGSTIPGAAAGLAVFLAWALGREVDPDHAYSALLAAALTAAALLVLPVFDVITLLWLLLLLRVVNRTTGRAATTTDVALVLILTLWPLRQGFLIAGPIAAAALILDGTLRKPAPHRIPAAALALAAAATAFFAGRGTAITTPPLPIGITIVVATVLFLRAIVASSTVRSSGDGGGGPLDPGRVRAAQALALATALVALPWNPAGVAPLWAAVLAAGIWQVWLMIRKNR
ncbi:hypothetical protein E2N92_10130 [Methanofollis formosanus]|uniref:Uncharacterized protein n=1 Tax=Methanofollis formosanus TaxID=299308 RepID=A0A8G1A299_9EURY|nr:hypothetical protein [Methanofollis formosanus]QYZ79760.1 hypothetical protein E2N92_10130 [Methanofollis formosanus]